MISDLVVFQHRDTYRELIRESLNFDFWTQPHLAQLKRQLSTRDSLDHRWRDSQASERAMTLAELDDDGAKGGYLTHVADINLFPYGVPATAKAHML